MSSFRKRRAPKTREPKEWDKIDIVGIDGEGEGDKPHRYTLLAASDGYQKRCVEAYSLDTYQCLEFLCSLHDMTDRQKLFVAFSFTYDLTMMLKDLPSSQLYLLQRPELRTIERHDYRVVQPIKWRGFKLNLQSTKFTVEDCRGQEKRMKIVMWDLFRFFGCAFTKALTDWGIRSKDQLASMQLMKDSRANFASLDAETIREYCYSECGALSELARKLIIFICSIEEPGRSKKCIKKSVSLNAGKNSEPNNNEPRPVATIDIVAIIKTFFGLANVTLSNVAY